MADPRAKRSRRGGHRAGARRGAEARTSIERAKADVYRIGENARTDVRSLGERTEHRVRRVVDAFERELAGSRGRARCRGGEARRPAADQRRRARALQHAVRCCRSRAHRSAAMIECGSLEYAQARMRARHGERLDPAAGAHRGDARVRALARARACDRIAALAGRHRRRQQRRADRDRAAQALAQRRRRGRGLDAGSVAAGESLVGEAAGSRAAAASRARRRGAALAARRRGLA